jgi:hypothetical protein
MRISGILLGIILLFTTLYPTPEAKSYNKDDLGNISEQPAQKSVKIIQIIKPRTMHFWYIVDVEICAGPTQLYSPDLVISSDRDEIIETFWGIIMPYTCDTGRFFISAKNPDSIEVGFANSINSSPASKSPRTNEKY